MYNILSIGKAGMFVMPCSKVNHPPTNAPCGMMDMVCEHTNAPCGMDDGM